uniref:Uncharacterized protein n=1 Tax=Glossina pallidipes TaxID=7398 RepID=A0A1A9ZUG2_GLOPL
MMGYITFYVSLVGIYRIRRKLFKRRIAVFLFLALCISSELGRSIYRRFELPHIQIARTVQFMWNLITKMLIHITLGINVLVCQPTAIKAARKQRPFFQLFSSSQTSRFSARKDTLALPLISGKELGIVCPGRGPLSVLEDTPALQSLLVRYGMLMVTGVFLQHYLMGSRSESRPYGPHIFRDPGHKASLNNERSVRTEHDAVKSRTHVIS